MRGDPDSAARRLGRLFKWRRRSVVGEIWMIDLDYDDQLPMLVTAVHPRRKETVHFLLHDQDPSVATYRGGADGSWELLLFK